MGGGFRRFLDAIRSSLAFSVRSEAEKMFMPLVSGATVFQKSVAALATYEPNEIVLAAGSKTGRLLILKEGAVAIIGEGIEIAKVTEPGAVFGELSALLDAPHTADVRTLQASQFTSPTHATAPA